MSWSYIPNIATEADTSGAAVRSRRRGDPGFARSSAALGDEQEDMIVEIGRPRIVLDEACAPKPAVAWEAACQKPSFGPAVGPMARLGGWNKLSF